MLLLFQNLNLQVIITCCLMLKLNKVMLGYIFLTLTTFAWGSTFLLVKSSVSKGFLNFNIFLALRFTFAFLILFLFSFIFQNRQLHLFLNFKLICRSLILGTLLFISFWFQTLGLLYTSASNAAFITSLNVVLIPLLAFLFPFNKKVRGKDFSFVLICLVGLTLISFDFVTFTINIGDAIILICAIAIAYHVLFTEKSSQNFSTVHLVCMQLFFLSLESNFVAILTQGIESYFNFEIIFHPVVIGALVITSVFATVFAFWSQTFAQKHKIPVTHIAIIFSLEPFFALLTDIFFVGIPDITKLIGMAIIFSSTLIYFFSENKIENNIK